jgi:hypothetical protein
VTLENFQTTWLSERLQGFYAGYAKDNVMNQCGLESKNRTMKDFYTFRALLPLHDCMTVLAKYVHDESYNRSDHPNKVFNYMYYTPIFTNYIIIDTHKVHTYCFSWTMDKSSTGCRKGSSF